MHLVRVAAAAAMVVASGLALTACGGNSGSAATGSSTVSAAGGGAASTPGDGSASGAGGGAGSTAPTGSTGAGAGSGSTGGGSTTSGGSQAAGSQVATCRTGDLGYSWGTPPPSGGTSQQQANVVLRNTSARTCAMHGFPGVDLVNSGTKWSLRRDAQTPATVTLRPGATTRFTVTFLPWVSDGGNPASKDFAPTTLVITPPNQRTSYDLPWRWGHVLLQDTATRPGTYIGPVGG